MNFLTSSGLLVIATLVMFSCEDPSDVGLAIDPDGLRLSVLYKEITLKMENVFIDSVRTSRDSRILLGRNENPIFGTTTSEACIQLGYLNTLYNLSVDTTTVDSVYRDLKYVVDSTVLFLQIDRVYTSEGVTMMQSYKVHQLEDTLFSAPFYLSRHKTPYNKGEIEGQFQFVLNEDRLRDSGNMPYILSFKMGDRMGEKLFNTRTLKNSATGSSQSDLRYSYKGIAIVGSPSNTVLLGVMPADSTSIKVYYHVKDSYEQGGVTTDSVYEGSLSLNISLSSSNTYYNSIKTDRTGSTMGAVGRSLDKFTTNNSKTYLQPISGVFPKIALKPLNDFLDSLPHIQINRMELELKTETNSLYYKNSANLRCFYIGGDGSQVNTAGLITNSLYNTAILTDASYLSGTQEVLVLPLNDSSLVYNRSATLFSQLLEAERLKEDYIVLMPTDLTSPDYSIFNQNTGMKIKLHYTIPEK